MRRHDAEPRWWIWDDSAGLVPGPREPGTPKTAGPGPELLAADSWLVRDGRMRGRCRHRARFMTACREEGLREERVARFWDAALAALPRRGSWFPRAELHADGVLGLRVRPSPPLRPDIRVLLPPRPDPRLAPARKGPDLPVLAELRRAAQREGADDVLLALPSGAVSESTTASLLWWDGATLCAADAGKRQLDGVTQALITELAAGRGVPVRTVPVGPEDLAGREVWLVNALHGIRPVSAWVGTGRGTNPTERARHWRGLLDALEEPLP
ncbi:aminotransferase class IV [Streptomyces sp. JJ38]|uniref:aminotransferase class IV n=1 Tax=Streptomyces sp. JJ38 TaxID=2738128 RepID=UPI001C573DA0|nr:aminotransferase class IV [Streptomyces sp. JJ38]MBW1597384.1 aminotransferase class IV [Streptomyces sp. JJ38]